MSKNSNGPGPVGPAAVHFVLQGKGGVGKSVVASWLAEFLASRRGPDQSSRAGCLVLGCCR
jgi:Mrp family chromosome partitioning ATPase